MTAHAPRFGLGVTILLAALASGGPGRAGAQPAPASPAPAAATPPSEAPPPAPPVPEPAAAPGGPRPAPPLRATPADPQEIELHLRDGQRVTGLLIGADDDELVVRISGINTRFATDTIDRYEILPPILERYLALRATIGDDVEQILRLAAWLQSREKYPLALTEVERALRLKPDSAEAKRMRLLLEQQIVLRSRARTGTDAPPDGEDPDGPAGGRPEPGAARPPAVEFPLLTPEQIGLVKVYEVDLAANPRLVIPRGAVLRMFQQNAGHPLVPVTAEGREAILRKKPVEILDLMFRLQARDLYPQVQVVDQPRAVRLFRDNVQRTWLLNSCATNQCHGGAEAGRLMLFNRRPNSDPSVYTNFYILQQYRLSDGTPLINWEDPEKSPLLHMGLPREDSLFPHPVVPRGPANRDAWQREFRSPEDRAFRHAVEWMESVYKPRPDYRIQYTPPRPFQLPPPARDEPSALGSTPPGGARGEGQPAQPEATPR